MIGYRTGPEHHPGGAAEAELQADVMRFVAILALCLVAISSLVESAANAPPAPADAAAPTPKEVVKVSPTPPPAARTSLTPVVTRSLPVAAPVSPTPPPSTAVPVADAGAATPSARRIEPPAAAQPAPTPVERPAGPPVKPAPVPVDEPRRVVSESVRRDEPRPAPVAATPPDRRGFTLRFESDAALLRLVSRGEAGVYVFQGSQALRLGFGPDGAQFAVAASPRSFHAISPDTVPAVLREALRRQEQDGTPVWGVTLPEESRRSLAELLRKHDHGTLTIDSRGRVRLENTDDV